MVSDNGLILHQSLAALCRDALPISNLQLLEDMCLESIEFAI